MITGFKRVLPRFLSRSRSFLALFACYFSVALFSGSLLAESDDALSLLQRAVEAGRQLSYGGIVVFQHGDGMETMRFSHHRNQKDGAVRLSSMSGAIVDRQYQEPASESDKSERSTDVTDGDFSIKVFGSLAFKNRKSLVEGYRPTIVGEERVVDRIGWLVNIEPKDNYRYGYRMVLDKEFSVVLKTQVFDKNNHLLEEMMFTEFYLLPESDIPGGDPGKESQTPALHHPAVSPGACDRKNLSSRPFQWKVDWIPPGFLSGSRKFFYCMKAPNSSGKSEHQMFSDGLASISVFIDAPEETHPSYPQIRHGSVGMFTLDRFGYRITAVGEVPMKTLEKVVHSVRQIKK